MRTIAALAASALILIIASVAPVAAGPAERAYHKGDLARAKKLYEERLHRDPEDARSRYNLGNVLYRSQDLKEAEEAYRTAIRSGDPAVRARAAHNLGNAQLRAGQVQPAIGSYIDALRTEPGNADSKYNLELALRMLQQQQQQQKQQQQGGKQDQKQDDQQKKQQNQQQQQPQQQKEQQQERQQGKDKDQPQASKGSPQPAPGEYTREEAERVLDGLSQEEKDLLADRLKAQGRNLRVEKDW